MIRPFPGAPSGLSAPIRLSVALALAALLTAPAPAQESFVTELVDDGELLGQHTSIDIDERGNPHISYQDVITIRLKYATRVGDTWNIEVADNALEDVGKYSSIAVDQNGDPWIAYYDDTLDRAKIAWKSGGVWTIEIIDDPAQDVGQYTSLAIDSFGNPHVVYYDATLGRLKYGVRILGTWFISVADDPAQDVGKYASIALDNLDRPHVAYFDETTPRIRYGARLGTTWTIVSVTQDPMSAGHTSIAIDEAGQAHIAYLRSGLIYYAFDETYPAFENEMVGSGDGFTSIVVDRGGTTPRIAWYETGIGDDNLEYGIRRDGVWEVSSLDRAGVVGQYASMALNHQGSAMVSYYDGSQGHLRMADQSIGMLEPAGGETWPVGAERTVRWRGVGPVDVQLSTDGGQTYRPLHESIFDTRVRVRVPHTPTRFARLRIRRADPFATSESDSAFTIDASVLLGELRVAAAPTGSGTVVAWETDPGPDDLLGYRVERGGRTGAFETLVALTRATRLEDPQGTAASRYRLHAVNGFGDELFLGEASMPPARPLSAVPLPYRGGDLAVTFATSGGLGGGSHPARLTIHDVGGRRVRELVRGSFAAGYRTVTWDGRDATGRAVPPGTYFVRLESAGLTESLKIVVVR